MVLSVPSEEDTGEFLTPLVFPTFCPHVETATGSLMDSAGVCVLQVCTRVLQVFYRCVQVCPGVYR